MKIEIDLDELKIDYDAINDQIKERIDCTVKEQIENRVRHYLCPESWEFSDLEQIRDVNQVIFKTIERLLKPYVENAINQIPQEELDKMISRLLPVVLNGLITSQLKGMLDDHRDRINQSVLRSIERGLLNSDI